jgi:hypothetical protein
MKMGSYIKIFLMIFISSLLAGNIYGLDKAQISESQEKDVSKDDSVNLKNSHLDDKSYYVLKDSVYGQCPCGHPTVTPDVECTVPGCPYSKRDD